MSRSCCRAMLAWLLLPARARRGPGRRRCPAQARPQLVGHDLDHRAAGAVVGLPGPLLQPAHDHHPAALRQGLRHTAGTLATVAGGSLREVMSRLGHSTTVAALRYQHVMADRDAAIARELNRLIEGG